MLSAIPTSGPHSNATLNSATSPTQSSSLPRRTDSLSSTIEKPKPISPLVQASEDAKYARSLLSTPIMTIKQERELGAEEIERRREQREGELIEVVAKMTGWVEELGALLQQAYKNQTDLETALTLTRSNLQLAFANNEMLEDALKRAGRDGKDIGWRRWSDREGVRRSSSVTERPNSVADVPASTHPPSPTSQHDQQPQQLPPPAPAPSRGFFNFASLTRPSTTSASTSPAAVAPIDSLSTPGPSSFVSSAPSPLSIAPQGSVFSSPSPSPAPSLSVGPSKSKLRENELSAELEKERAAVKEMAQAKAQLENELESLSQALFEEANKMVSEANRRLAETQEELRITMEQREALKGALRIVEGENGVLRSSSRQSQNHRDQNQSRSRSGHWQNENSAEDGSQIVEICNPELTFTSDTLTPRAGEHSRSRSRSNSESGDEESLSESPSHSQPSQQQSYVLHSDLQSHSEPLAQLRLRSSSLIQLSPQPQPQSHNDESCSNPNSRSSSVSQSPPLRPASASSVGRESPMVTLPVSNPLPHPSGSFWSPVTPSSDGYGSGRGSTPSDGGEEGGMDEGCDDVVGGAGGTVSGMGIGRGTLGRGWQGIGNGYGHGQVAEMRYLPRMSVGLSALSPIAEALSPPVSAGLASIHSAGSQAQYVVVVPGSSPVFEPGSASSLNTSLNSPQPDSAASQYSFESGGRTWTPQSAVFSPHVGADVDINTHIPQSTVTPATPPLALPLSPTMAPDSAESEPLSSILASPSQPAQTPATPQFLLYPPTIPGTRSTLTPGTSASTASSGSPQSALFPSSSAQRWSTIPKTPRSRIVVKSEFEKAMEMMRGIVGDVGDVEYTDGTETSEGLEGSVKGEEMGEGEKGVKG